MEKVFEIKDGRKFMGFAVCEGPQTYRVMVTWPYREEGRVVEVDRREIEEIRTVDSVAIGEKPILLGD